MLALTIIGTGVVTLVVGASRCLTVVRRAKNFQTARHVLAKAELENPLQLEEEITEDMETFTFSEPEFRGFKVTRSVVAEGDPEEGLFKVGWTVSWSDAGRASSESVETMLYAPEAVEGGTVAGGG
jgi:hypothetical protein